MRVCVHVFEHGVWGQEAVVGTAGWGSVFSEVGLRAMAPAGPWGADNSEKGYPGLSKAQICASCRDPFGQVEETDF